jgi:pyruvate dehydrogenase E2 component (dihydrolipoamide acetyltransferase)
MAEEVFIPKLGQTVEEVTLINWLVKEGDKVETGQGILEVETDKAVFTVESSADGIIHTGPFKAGDVIPNLTVVAVIGKAEEQFTVKPSTSSTGRAEVQSESLTAQEQTNLIKAVQSEAGKVFISPRARKLADEKKADITQIVPTGGEGVRIVEKDVAAYFTHEVKVSPLAQRMAQEANLDLRKVKGTGLQGEITKGDVEKAIADSKTRVPDQPMTAAPLPGAEVVERIPLKGIRALIAERMSASVHTSARFTLFIEADATKLVQLREALKAQVEKDWGFAPSYNDLMAKIVARALRKYPYVNARLAADAIEHLGHIHIGMATDTERGLMVPVIRDVDLKNLHQFGTQFRQLVEQARNGHIALDDLKGGTFTMTNLGTYDILTFVPVINLPEAAILALGKIIPKAVVVGDGIAIRQMWMLALVVDHRIVDGAPAARFLQFIKDEVENPDENLFT